MINAHIFVRDPVEAELLSKSDGLINICLLLTVAEHDPGIVTGAAGGK